MAGNYIRTPEHRKMMSEKFKGRDCYWSRGKKRPTRSDEWCKNISLAKKNNKECIKNLGIWASEDRPYLSVDVNREKNPNWKGGIKNQKGYLQFKVPKGCRFSCMKDKKGYISFHRSIMAEYLQRPLKPEEVVHHINEDITDNKIENLELFENNGKHISFHLSGRDKGIS